MTFLPGPARRPSVLAVLTLVSLLVLLPASGSVLLAQEFTPEMLEKASQETGLSKEELLRRYQQQQKSTPPETDTPDGAEEPGRTDLEGIDDSGLPLEQPRFRDTNAQVILPFSQTLDTGELDKLVEVVLDTLGPRFFGEDFFHLDGGLFTPPSFGPVSADHRLGVGDEIVINVWGEVDLQLTRVVDRDGSIILPRVGKIACAGRSLKEVDGSIRSRLAESHSSIDVDGQGEEGSTFVEVTVGQLRAIRVFVVGQVVKPGSFELSSVSTVLTALYAAGGPSDLGTFRHIEIVRGGQTIGTFDLYNYLMGGSRAQDLTLREGDTVFVGDRGISVEVTGAVRRPMFYEIRQGENLGDLVTYAGGFQSTAAPEVIHVRRILPPALRQPGKPDHVYLDVPFDVVAMESIGGVVPLLDGDAVQVSEIGQRIENWVEVQGSVKRPGRYQYREGMTVRDLLELASGLWPDALTEIAVIDRTGLDLSYSSVTVPLAKILSGNSEPVALQAMDVVHVFARWETQVRPQVHITGEVFEPLSTDFRKGMTLRDLVLKAGGLRESADWLRADVARLQLDALRSSDISERPSRTSQVIKIELGGDFLTRESSFTLQPYDRVAIRKLPWWEMEATVTVRGEVFFPGVFSLERNDERLSSILSRAGGLKPDAYTVGARIERAQDEVGNIAIDLDKALADPGSQYDLILQDGDHIVIPDRMFTVKVVGEVGFPTSMIFEDGKNINYYVDRAGGYLEKADKGKARVVYPNGMSLPNKGGSKVVAGSTIIVPLKPPPEGKTTIETIRDITGIAASLAMVWLVIENTNR